MRRSTQKKLDRWRRPDNCVYCAKHVDLSVSGVGYYCPTCVRYIHMACAPAVVMYLHRTSPFRTSLGMVVRCPGCSSEGL